VAAERRAEVHDDTSREERLRALRGQTFRSIDRLLVAGAVTPVQAAFLERLTMGAILCPTGVLVNVQQVAFLAMGDAASDGRTQSAGERQVSRLTRELEHRGLILNRTLSNGLRLTTQARACGLVLTPLIERAHEAEAVIAARLMDARESNRLRDLLRGLKGDLKRAAARCGCAEIASAAQEFYASLPRRFAALPVPDLRVLIETVERWLSRLRESFGRSMMSDRADTNGRPSTITNEEESLSNGAAGEEAPTRTVAPGSRAEALGAFDIGLEDALTLVAPDEQAVIRDTYGTDAAAIWQELGQQAVFRWRCRGGDPQTAAYLARAIGERQATVLLLLAVQRERFATGDQRVRSLPRYLMGCARKAVAGQFMWGAGVRSVGQLVASDAGP
jgi:hypothetical protein